MVISTLLCPKYKPQNRRLTRMKQKNTTNFKSECHKEIQNPEILTPTQDYDLKLNDIPGTHLRNNSILNAILQKQDEQQKTLDVIR